MASIIDYNFELIMRAQNGLGPHQSQAPFFQDHIAILDWREEREGRKKKVSSEQTPTAFTHTCQNSTDTKLCPTLREIIENHPGI